MTAGAVGFGNKLLTDKIHNTVQDSIGDAMPHIADYADEYMQQRGMLNDEGQFDPAQAFDRRGGVMGGIQQKMDGLFRGMGMDPSHMSPIQKMMILGGTGMGGVGAMTGHPLMAAMGVGGAAAGFAPYMMGQGPQQQWGRGQQQPGQQFTTQQPNQPQARDEYQHQLQQQQYGGM